jgi:rhodanese-related sulfurtransferase
MTSPPLDIEISVAELAARLQAGERLPLLDVREAWEFDYCHLDGARLLPMPQIPMHLTTLADEFDGGAEAEIICYCHTGHRSLTAADWMRRAGLPRARSLAGGIDEWSRLIDPTLPRY